MVGVGQHTTSSIVVVCWAAVPFVYGGNYWLEKNTKEREGGREGTGRGGKKSHRLSSPHPLRVDLA